MFIPDLESGSEHFSIPDLDPNISHPGSDIKIREGVKSNGSESRIRNTGCLFKKTKLEATNFPCYAFVQLTVDSRTTAEINYDINNQCCGYRFCRIRIQTFGTGPGRLGLLTINNIS
jgi:hypothetical protein